MNNAILFSDVFQKQNTAHASVLWFVFNLKQNFTVDDSGKI